LRKPASTSQKRSFERVEKTQENSEAPSLCRKRRKKEKTGKKKGRGSQSRKKRPSGVPPGEGGKKESPGEGGGKRDSMTAENRKKKYVNQRGRASEGKEARATIFVDEKSRLPYRKR